MKKKIIVKNEIWYYNKNNNKTYLKLKKKYRHDKMRCIDVYNHTGKLLINERK